MNSPVEKTEPVSYRWTEGDYGEWKFANCAPDDGTDLENFEPLYSASTVEALKAERDAAFAMSKCECGPDEACANLASLNAKLEALKAENAALLSRVERMEEALTPSGDTKHAYHGEFKFNQTAVNDDDEEFSYPTYVPWTTVKEIMAAISARAALQETKP